MNASPASGHMQAEPARQVVDASRIAHMMMCAIWMIICANPSILDSRSAGLSARMRAVQLLLAVLACGELTRKRDHLCCLHAHVWQLAQSLLASCPGPSVV